ncbi:MAG: TolC family protein [Bacteroidota bacterium]
MKPLIDCILITIFFLNTGIAQTPLSLKAALQYTVENNAQVQKAEIDIKYGKSTLKEAVSAGLPQISANATMLNNLALRTSLIPAEFVGGSPGEFAQLQFGTNWNGNAGVQFDQMIFNKQWLLALEGSKKLNDFYDISLVKSKEEVIYETAKLYYQIQLTETQRGILIANLEKVNGLHALTDRQYQEGFAKRIDVDRLKVQQSNLLTQLNNLNLQIEQLEQALKFAMQMPLDTEIELTDTIALNPLDSNISLLQPAYQTRPTLTLLQVQQDLYDLDYRRWRAGHFPTVSLFGNYTYEWQANSLGEFTEGIRWTDFSQLGLYINFPIFDGLLKKSRMEMAAYNKLKVAKDFDYTLLGFQLQHQNAVSSLELNRNNLQAVIETRAVAEDVYRITEKRYKEGIAPITELLDAESSMREAQSNYITTLAQIKLAEIDLMHANGKLIQLIEGQ